jgi:hypothetical protein
MVTGSLGEISVVDLLSFFNMFRKTGVLRFDLFGGRKDLYLARGRDRGGAQFLPGRKSRRDSL